MTVITLDATSAPERTSATHNARADEMAVRRAAQEFEAMLLNQLTASLNSTSDSEEGSLFGGETGTGLYKQMFSEQLAKTMSQAGGVGLADLMLKQMLPAGSKSAASDRAAAGVRELRRSNDAPAPASDSKALPSNSRIARATNAATKSFAVEASSSAGQNDDVFLVSEADSGAEASVEASDIAPQQQWIRPRRVHPMPSGAASAEARPASFSPRPAEVALQLPIRGVLTSKFGRRIDPINGHRKFHAGVDIAAPRGTPIGAAADGEVVFAGRKKGYGNTVVVEHADGRRTRYAHAERLFVKVGDRVDAGQPIAAVGSTGHSTGPHLHFEVTAKNGQHLNPLENFPKAFTLARR